MVLLGVDITLQLFCYHCDIEECVFLCVGIVACKSISVVTGWVVPIRGYVSLVRVWASGLCASFSDSSVLC